MHRSKRFIPTLGPRSFKWSFNKDQAPSLLCHNFVTDHARRPRVVIAEDHAELLEKVAMLLATEFEVVAKVRDGASAFQSAIDSDPDVLLLDLYIPKMNGLEVVRALRKRRARTSTLIMSGSDDIEMVEAAIAAGATS